MYRLPGLSLRAATFVVELAQQHSVDGDRPTGRPKALSVVAALRLTLCRPRRNATYQDLHEDVDTGTTTVYCYQQTMVAFRADAFGCKDADSRSELVAGRVCLIDGTLIPTFIWHHRNDLLSGKHRRDGVNIQLLVDLHGRLLVASRAFPGSWHDVRCFRQVSWVELVRRGGGIADLGYQGEPDVVHTPIKKQPNVDLGGLERQLNQSSARLRAGAERGVSHLKNRRTTTSRYRSDLSRIDTDIQAAVGLQKLNEQCADRRLTYNRIKAVVSE